MTQRTLAAVIALPVVLALIVLAWVLPLPYTIYRPGPTVNVLGTLSVTDKSIATYPDTGAQIRMVTVNETLPSTRNGLFSLLGAWISRDDAIYPKSVAYPPQSSTDQENQEQGQQEMSSAQETAEQVALAKLGYDVFRGAKVSQIEKGSPAVGHFAVGDVISAVNGTAVHDAASFGAAVRKLTPGRPAAFSLTRDGAARTVTATPSKVKGVTHLGVTISDAITMPFTVKVGIDPSIGGPSAGLMMTLAIYDYLTPGSLTDDQPIAGTGTIATDGSVGPIGGIQQKIPAAKHAGAKLFFVPAANCADIAGSDHGSMRLVKVTSFDDALSSLATWTKDPSAPLPSCS